MYIKVMSFTKLTNGRLTNLNDVPLNDRDAVNQNYVDGRSQKTSVKAASVANVALTENVIDGITIDEGQRVLLKDQTQSSENGIYVMSSGTLVRANGAEETDIASGCSVFVTDGLVNDDTQWQCSATYGTMFGSAIYFKDVNPETIAIQGYISNVTKGGYVVKYVSWNLTDIADVGGLCLGVSGKIIKFTATLSSDKTFNCKSGDSLAFSIGTTDMTTFTPFAGGEDVIEFNNTHDGTFPCVTTEQLMIPFGAEDKLAIRSSEYGVIRNKIHLNFVVICQLDLRN